MDGTTGTHSTPGDPSGMRGPTPVRILACNGCHLVYEELAAEPRDPLHGCPRCSRQDAKVIGRTEH